MNILIVMIPLSILLLIGAGIAFFWAVDHDQFDDFDTPRLLPLLDVPDAHPDTPPENAPCPEGLAQGPIQTNRSDESLWHANTADPALHKEDKHER